MPIGHCQLLINKVAKIWSPHSKALLTSLDTQEMQTSDGTLQPKDLFPLAPNSSTSACGPIDHRIEEYNYCTPFEKHLNNLMNEVEMKETKATKLRCQINSLSECTLPKGQQDDDPGHYYCSLCHESEWS